MVSVVRGAVVIMVARWNGIKWAGIGGWKCLNERHLSPNRDSSIRMKLAISEKKSKEAE